MAEKNPPPEDDALSSLRRRVAKAREAESAAASKDRAPPSNAASMAMRMGGEFVAALLVGAAIGFGIDQFAPTKPWGLVVGLVMGFAAGVTNVVRAAKTYSAANPSDPNAPSIPDDEDD